MTVLTKRQRRLKRRRRVRARVNGTAERPRLSVYRSNRGVFAQLIDDTKGHTVAAASTLDKDLKSLKTGADVAAAAAVGKLVAERATKAGVKEVVFDRGGYQYHGRVKAVADGAREAGLAI